MSESDSLFSGRQKSPASGREPGAAHSPQPAPEEGPSTLVLRWPWGADGQSGGWEWDCRGSGINERLCTSLGVPRPWERVTATEGQLLGLGEVLQGVQRGGLGLLVLAHPLEAPLGSQFLHQKSGDDLHPSHLLGGGTEGLLPSGGRSQWCVPQWTLWPFRSPGGHWGARAASPVPTAPP